MDSSLLFIVHIISTYGYVALFVIVFIGGTYLPIPGALLLIAVGVFAREGYFNIYLAFIVTLAAGISSDIIPFEIARKFGKRDFFKKYIDTHANAKKIQTYMRKYPKATIFLSRFVGFISTPVNILAGLSRVHFMTFLSVDVVGEFINAALYLTIGFLVGAEAEGSHFISVVGVIVGAALVMYVLVFLVLRRMKVE